MILTQISGPVENPVTLDECKADCRVEFNDEDGLISAYIDAATRAASEVTSKKLVNETWRLSTPNFCVNKIEIPFVDVSSIESVSYYDLDDNLQTIAVNQFYKYDYETKTVLEAKDTLSIPSLKKRNDALQVEFVTGYGPSAASVPATIKKAIRLIVAHWYQNREDTSEKTLSSIPMGADTLLSLERIGWVG